MKDQVVRVRTDDEFISKLNYLKEINGYKTTSETIRRIIEKEYVKETKK